MSIVPFTFFFFFLGQFHIAISVTPFVALIDKDEPTNLYTISISLKTPLQPTSLLLDLGGTFCWIDCTPDYYTSTSYHYIPCDTSLCDSLSSGACSNCYGSSGPGCHTNACALYSENPVTRTGVIAQALVDSLALTTTDGRRPGRYGVVPNFVVSCSDASLFEGLPEGVTGLAGFGRSNFSLPAQVSSVYASPYLFALCLSGLSNTSSGSAFFNTEGPYYFSTGIDLSTHLIYTPLIINPVRFTTTNYSQLPSTEYFIGVTSINVNGKPLDFNRSLLTIDHDGIGGTRLSTVTPYTVLQTSIYNAFTQAFIKESMAFNLTVTEPTDPFDVCYLANDVMDTALGPAFPTIDLVIHREDVFWRIFGGNSMVRIETEDGGDLWCLGFVDGGDDPTASVVIGGYQMEDNLLQFDLVSERFGFSSSVLVHNTNCASFNSASDPRFRQIQP